MKPLINVFLLLVFLFLDSNILFAQTVTFTGTELLGCPIIESIINVVPDEDMLAVNYEFGSSYNLSEFVQYTYTYTFGSNSFLIDHYQLKELDPSSGIEINLIEGEFFYATNAVVFLPVISKTKFQIRCQNMGAYSL